MRPLTASHLLHTWENNQHLHPIDRALGMLMAAEAGPSWETLAHLPVGEREARLLAVRTLTLGPRLRAYVECPSCGERLEFELDARQLQPPANSASPADGLYTEIEGFELHYRLPDSFDLAEAARCADLSRARRLLFERCVIGAQREGRPVSIEALPPAVEAGLAAALALADPLADLQVEMVCPACARPCAVTLDVGEFFWGELLPLARQTLEEVHVLASAYGWAEADILAMSAVRRQAYLEKASSTARRERHP